MFTAMILAAGLGTRLQPLTFDRPKALVPVGDATLLQRATRDLEQAGASRVVVNAHGWSTETLEEARGYSPNLELSVEAELLGTAGGIARARPLLRAGPVLVYNADIVTQPPVASLLERARAVPIVLCLAECSQARGTVGVGADGRIVRLRGERFGDEVASGDYVGVAAVSRAALDTLPERGCLIGDWVLPALRSGASIGAVSSALSWRDTGTLSQYWAANLAWLGPARSSWSGPGATVASQVRLDQCVIGAGAKVVGAGRVERCVVWPGAIAEAPLADCIVTPRRVVPV